jgi:hypothetical protein
MEKYTFKVYAIHPEEYRLKFYESLNREKEKGNIDFVTKYRRNRTTT